MQTALFPALLSHRDIVLKDMTGSGKSVCVLAAVLGKKSPLVLDANNKKLRFTANVIVAPSPELALQFFEWSQRLLHGIAPQDLAKHVQVLVPHSDFEHQHTLLQQHTPTTLIATPRRLLDVVVNQRLVDVSRLQTLVLDEADSLVRVPSRYETNKEKLNRINHPLFSELVVDYIIKLRRPESFGGSIGSKLTKKQLAGPSIAPLPASISRAQQHSSTLLETRARQIPNTVVDAAAARRLQVVLCSATINNPVRRELERMRGWIVDPIVMDVNGTHGAPPCIEHVCLIVEKDGRTIRNMHSKEEQDRIYAESNKERDAKDSVDPVWISKMKFPALEDDDPRIIKIVANLCKQESVKRGILFLNSNISCARVVEQLKKLGIKAARISEDVDYQTTVSNFMAHHHSPSSPDSLATVEAPPTFTTTPVVKSSLFFQSNQELMVISEHNARGLDLPDVSHVFLVGPPSSPASFLHMSGRVGRFGKSGKTILVLGGERYERKQADLFKLLAINPSKHHGVE
ncbi:UNVERIFIED_CONTAM: hypothetical protein HDU68_007318 [Siphonaria sp. JEL0065]|nr:hypothetical protein HDU68_007318 [Siphonaria sp. JEL0065]